MMTDEQFSKLIHVLELKSNDHDLLVRIATTIDNINKSRQEESERQSKHLGKLEDSTVSAHKRIDDLKIDMTAYLNRFQGIVIAINVIGFIAMGFINFIKK